MKSKHVCDSVSSCVCLHVSQHLPKALYSGVLHDRAGGEAKGVGQVVRRRDGGSLLILMGLGAFSAHPLPAEPRNTRLALTERERETQGRYYLWGLTGAEQSKEERQVRQSDWVEAAPRGSAEWKRGPDMSEQVKIKVER